MAWLTLTLPVGSRDARDFAGQLLASSKSSTPQDRFAIFPEIGSGRRTYSATIRDPRFRWRGRVTPGRRKSLPVRAIRWLEACVSMRVARRLKIIDVVRCKTVWVTSGGSLCHVLSRSWHSTTELLPPSGNPSI